MAHALIIGHDRHAAEEVEDGLWQAGYQSMVHVLDADDAWAILHSLRPSLIVLLPDKDQCIASDDLCRMSELADAPVLVATANPAKALECIGPGVTLSGAYPIERVADAVEEASVRSSCAHAA